MRQQPAKLVGGAAWASERAAQAYRRARPEYPPAVVEHLAAELGLDARSLVVDVGAGTGKLTCALVAAGLRPVAVEPLEAMLNELRRELPGAPAARAVAERLPLAPRSADAVTVAAAFHWFDRDRAAAEFRRVLRPGGGLALLWQARVELASPWVRVGPILDRHRSGHPGTGGILAAVGDLPGFTPLRRAKFPNVEVHTPQGVVDRVLSVSYIAALPAATRQAVAAEVAGILAGHDDVTLEYEVVVFTARAESPGHAT